MNGFWKSILVALPFVCLAVHPAFAQKAPEVGYLYPAGAKAGNTIEVRLGGYDWTPDVDAFSLDTRVQIELRGELSDFLITPPPYWFGHKGRIAPHKIPREQTLRITLPADLPAGPVEFQFANANGATAPVPFFVGTAPEVFEAEFHREPQPLPALPVTVNGRLSRIEEVDQYRISRPDAGLITCELFARRLGATFHGIIEVRDEAGRLVADAADTEGRDVSLTFHAEAGVSYLVSLHDVDFDGDWSFVYRLQFTSGPRVVAAIPATARRGETRSIGFVGYGVASGQPKLESITRDVTFPNDANVAKFAYVLETPFGTAPAVTLHCSDRNEVMEPAATAEPAILTFPVAMTGLLDVPGDPDRFSFSGRKGESIHAAACSQSIEAPLDLELILSDTTGKELARNDDLPDTTDAELSFILPADGDYVLAVNDLSGKSGSRSAVYRLIVESSLPEAANTPDFALDIPRLAGVPIDGKFDLPVKVLRKRGYTGPIQLSVTGLPAGVTVPDELLIPEKKNDLKVALTCAADAPTGANFIHITATATAGDTIVTRTSAPLLLARTMKPRAKVEPVDKDGGRTVHRGTTYPAEVIVTRMEDFTGEVVLQMAAKQGYQVQGSRGWDVVVPPDVTRTHYPCYMPEWLEVDRTSRMVVVAVTRVPDPSGRVRHLVSLMDGRITMSMEGALMKVSHAAGELSLEPGGSIEIPVTVARSPKLPESVTLELVVPSELEGLLRADPVTVTPGQTEVRFRVETVIDPRLDGEANFTIRGTAMQEGKLPVISQTDVPLVFTSADSE